MKITDLKKSTQEFIALNGFTELTKIQEAVISLALKNKDIVAIGETGTGKTHAYLIPLMEKLQPEIAETQAIISVPTRELAFQIEQEARVMKKIYPNLRLRLLTGGTDTERSLASLQNIPQLVIGTPGRIKDLYLKNALRVDQVRTFVVDEADMTLEYGFLEDIDIVFSKMSRNPQIMCFSATFPEELRPFTKKYLANPQLIRVLEDEKFDPRIQHIAIACKHKAYEQALLDILPGFDPYVCLIFGNTREECNICYETLRQNGYKALLLHGGLSARERQKAMRLLAAQEYRYIVASDVAARGIDIAGITHVVSLGFPSDLSFYTHRSGRTGRNGREGTCFALYKDSDIAALKLLAKKGIHFSFRQFREGNWKDLKNPLVRKRRVNAEYIKALTQLLTKKNEKVKPNYKKKKRAEVAKIQRKQRREFIQKKIMEQRKQRYKKEAKHITLNEK